MFSTTLRSVGGSVMFAIPKSILDLLGLSPNQRVGLTLTDGRLIVEPNAKPHYRLEELLAECDFEQPMAAEAREWLGVQAVGHEIP